MTALTKFDEKHCHKWALLLRERREKLNQALPTIANEDFDGAKRCIGQVEGWTHFLCCLKAYLEYSINLRVGAFLK